MLGKTSLARPLCPNCYPLGFTKSHKKELEINRIYERGEILAVVRSLMSVLWKPSKRAPEIRGTRYFLFFAWNPIVGHSMVRMAVRMSAAARH
jgi:hypothetical protein